MNDLALHPLRRWRKENGVTLASLASVVGVTSSHLSMLESGRRGASVDLLKRLTKATGGDVGISEMAEAAE